MTAPAVMALARPTANPQRTGFSDQVREYPIGRLGRGVDDGVLPGYFMSQLNDAERQKWWDGLEHVLMTPTPASYGSLTERVAA